MKLSRFGILGASPARVSILGRRVVEALIAEGAELAVWIEGNQEPPLPWDLHRPAALPLPAAVTVCSRATADVALEKHSIDFLLQLDQGPSDYTQPRHGVWRLTTASPAPLAFWDVYDGCFHLEIRLARNGLRPEQCVPLERRWIAVDRLSYARTLDHATAEMAEMTAHVARCGPPEGASVVVFPPALSQWPSASTLAAMRLREAIRFAAAQLDGLLFSETWQVGLVEAPVTGFLDMGYQPEIRWLPHAGRRRFLADPFLVRRPDGWLLLAEEFDFATNLGRIVQEFSVDGNLTGQVENAIVETCHMSYPFPLEHAGELYCVPETHQLDGVYAWRWDAARQSWKDRKLILPGWWLDATPVFHENLWWMFATHKDNGPDSKLHLFFADSPWGPWQPHARNPVKVDVRGSRPGGMPFVSGGILYRPAQDSSKHYGWRLVLNAVNRITPTEFSEDVIRVIDSDRIKMRGVHTLSGAAQRTLIDACKPRFVPARAARVLAHKLRKLAGL